MKCSSRTGIAGALLGFLGVVLGAIGAHALETVLPSESLESYKTGVYYLQWHGSLLLILGLFFRDKEAPFYIRRSILFFSMGIFLFSGSIFGLVFLPMLQVNASFLGPITPLGGLSLMMGWLCLFLYFIPRLQTPKSNEN
jgi:uncharacterized membrane protein YgdD (TMEM256/DUF423 family)